MVVAHEEVGIHQTTYHPGSEVKCPPQIFFLPVQKDAVVSSLRVEPFHVYLDFLVVCMHWVLLEYNTEKLVTALGWNYMYMINIPTFGGR